MVKNLPANTVDMGSIPDLGTKISHAGQRATKPVSQSY